MLEDELRKQGIHFDAGTGKIMSVLLKRAYRSSSLSHVQKLELTIAARNVELHACKKKINEQAKEIERLQNGKRKRVAMKSPLRAKQEQE